MIGDFTRTRPNPTDETAGLQRVGSTTCAAGSVNERRDQTGIEQKAAMRALLPVGR